MDEENTTAAAADAAHDTAEQSNDESTAAVQENADSAPADETASGADAPTDDAKDKAASSGRPKRVRKTTTNYVPEEEMKKEMIIPDGKGEKLGEMPNVVNKFGDVTWSTPCLKSLYYIVFGVGKKAEFKKHLLQFNGFNFSEEKEEAELDKVTQKIHKLKLDQLKEIMDLCDIDRSMDSFEEKKNPDKDMLSTRFLEWLQEPKASGKKLKKVSAKRKSSSSSAAAAKAPKKKSPPKKAKKEASKPKKKKQTAQPADEDEEVNIPGVSTDKIRSKIQSIVANADKDSVTVKDVRKKLEDWLDMDLLEYKNSIRALVMDAM